MTPWTPEFEHLLRRHCHFVAPDEPVDPDLPLGALGVDSLAFLSLIVEIEARLSVAVPDAMLAEENDSPLGLWLLVSGLLERQRGGVQ